MNGPKKFCINSCILCKHRKKVVYNSNASRITTVEHWCSKEEHKGYIISTLKAYDYNDVLTPLWCIYLSAKEEGTDSSVDCGDT